MLTKPRVKQCAQLWGIHLQEDELKQEDHLLQKDEWKVGIMGIRRI